MDPLLFSIGVGGSFAGFVVGVIFAKSVLSEAASIKQHVSDEVAELRADVASLLGKAKGEVTGVKL
jgi:hypothetical protein